MHYRLRRIRNSKIVPRIRVTDTGQPVRLERFSHYVARQMGFADKRECPHLCKLASDYIKKTEGVEENIYAFFSHDPEVDSLFIKLIEEFERCILSYFAFHWRHAHTMISQVLGSGSGPKKKFKHIVMAATREQRFERVLKNLKVARVFNTLVEEMKAIGVATADDSECTDVMVPMAHKDRSPVLLFMGGGMGAGKSTVLKDVLKEPFWADAAANAVVIEADAFKESDVIYRALSSRGHHDMLQTAELPGFFRKTDTISGVLHRFSRLLCDLLLPFNRFSSPFPVFFQRGGQGPVKSSFSEKEAMHKRATLRSLQGIALVSPFSINRCSNSLKSMLDERADEYPSTVHFDAFHHRSMLREKDVEVIKSTYSGPDCLRVRRVKPSERACNLCHQRLFVFKAALHYGLRFPLNPFIPRLLAELKIHPCQFYPNGCSLNDSNHNWNKKFVIVEWKDGDWGVYFIHDFSSPVDSSHFILNLFDAELHARDLLIDDDGRTPYWEFVMEVKLVEAGLSCLSIEVAKALDAKAKPSDAVTGRMARNAIKKANHIPKVPAFLEASGSGLKRAKDFDGSARTPFEPGWGISSNDSVFGNPALALEWSRNCITPPDLLSVSSGEKLLEAEMLGAHALYQANAYFAASSTQAVKMRGDYHALQASMKQMTISLGEWESRAHEVEGKLSIMEKKYASSEEKMKKE
ncbi:hypothetical protein AgCh_021815 [Apium graveolens]